MVVRIPRGLRMALASSTLARIGDPMIPGMVFSGQSMSVPVQKTNSRTSGLNNVSPARAEVNEMRECGRMNRSRFHAGRSRPRPSYVINNRVPSARWQASRLPPNEPGRLSSPVPTRNGDTRRPFLAPLETEKPTHLRVKETCASSWRLGISPCRSAIASAAAPARSKNITLLASSAIECHRAIVMPRWPRGR